MIRYTLLFFGALFLITWIATGSLFSPSNSEIGSIPTRYESETIEVDGTHGWYIPAKAHKACILLMHSIRSNRSGMLSRAEFLREEGYSSLVIDLYAHGKTQGEAITYGYKESESARSAVEFLYTKKECPKVVAIGYSLGGAASLLGNKPIDVDAYILEAVYPTIENALRNRLEIYFGFIGQKLAPLLYQQIPLRLGIRLEDLQPLSAIKKVNSPVLIMHGSEDKRTTLEEAILLYENAPYPKEFYKMNGAAHTNLYEFDRGTYKKIILQFLSKYVDT